MTTLYNFLPKTSSTFFLIVINILLTACGGNEEENKTNSTVQEETYDIFSELEVPIINETVAQLTENIATDNLSENEEKAFDMDTLVAAENFDFINKEEITVTLNFAEYKDKRGYISVYQAYRTIEDGKLFPLADSRVLAGSLIDGEFRKSFTNLNNTQQFLIELWFYDGTKPIQTEITVVNSQLTW